MEKETLNKIESLYLSLFKNYNALFDYQIKTMSFISMEIIKRIDLKGLADQREANFNLPKCHPAIEIIIINHGHGTPRKNLLIGSIK